jgi:hypothetical protein
MNAIFERVIQRFPRNFKITDNRDSATIRDNQIPQGQGYLVTVEPVIAGYRATIRFEDFALPLFKHVESRLEQGNMSIRQVFEANKDLALRIVRQSVETLYQVPDVVDDGLWVEIEVRNSDQSFCFDRFLDVLVSILVDLFPYELEGELEGDRNEHLMDVTERNLWNRSICLAFHGYDCNACGTNMQYKYGAVAYQFIHVHHLVPLSVRGRGVTDPVKEMIPLCPNCHAIAHLRNPPYSVAELRGMLVSHSNTQPNGQVRVQTLPS